MHFFLNSFIIDRIQIALAALILIQATFTIVLGLEILPALVILLILLFGIVIIVEPYFSFFLLVIVTHLIEGKYLELFILFRLWGFNWYLMDIILVLIYLSVFFRFFYGEFSFKLNPIANWLIIFFFTCFFSVFIGIKNGYATQAVLFDLRVFLYYSIFFPTVLILHDFSKLKKIFYFILSVGTIKCLVDSFLSIFILPGSFDNVSLSFLPFARLTGYSEIIYPLTLISALSYFLFQKQIEKKIIIIPSILISIIALYLSYTRGSWVSAILAIILLFILLIRSKVVIINWRIMSLISVTIFSILLLLTFFNIISLDIFLGRLTSITLEKIDISNLGRLVEYVTAIEAFLSNPITGAGFGLMFNYFSPGIGYLSTIYCHNSYLYILSKMGLIGFIPFLFLLLYSIRVGIRILNSKLSLEEICIAFSFIMMLLFLIIKSFTTWHLNTVTFSMFIGLLFGISSIYHNKLKAL